MASITTAPKNKGETGVPIPPLIRFKRRDEARTLSAAGVADEGCRLDFHARSHGR
jgi:hypothetical protein